MTDLQTPAQPAAPPPGASVDAAPRAARRARGSQGAGFVGRRGYPVLLLALTALLVFAILLAISVGSVSLPLGTVWRVVANHLLWFREPAEVSRTDDGIIWAFRVPRALLAVVVGAGLAVAGTVLQAIVRNPLADPYVLGVVQGGSFGAVLVIALGSAAVGHAVLSAAAFTGSMTSLLLVMLLGRRGGRVQPTRLVLAGVAIGYLFTAGTSFVQLRMSDGNSLAGVVFWLLGTVASASWADLGIPTAVVVGSVVFLLLHARALNALLMGEESATALGVEVSRLRLQLLATSAMLTGTVVAVAGGVGFVGLLVPHACRMLVGSDHRRVLPVAVLVGGIFLEVVDLGARTLASPLELPLDVITAAVGAPAFLLLMRRAERTASL